MNAFQSRLFVFGLWCALAAGSSTLPGETLAASTPIEANRGRQTAKIIAIDNSCRDVTLQIKDRYYDFFLSPQAVDAATHKQLLLDQLAPGQFIRFVSRPLATGRLEIVSLAILPSKASGDAGSGGNKGGGDVSPFR